MRLLPNSGMISDLRFQRAETEPRIVVPKMSRWSREEGGLSVHWQFPPLGFRRQLPPLQGGLIKWRHFPGALPHKR